MQDLGATCLLFAVSPILEILMGSYRDTFLCLSVKTGAFPEDRGPCGTGRGARRRKVVLQTLFI